MFVFGAIFSLLTPHTNFYLASDFVVDDAHATHRCCGRDYNHCLSVLSRSADVGYIYLHMFVC
jgi:hypothetical protein